MGEVLPIFSHPFLSYLSTSIDYIAVFVNLICFGIYLLFSYLTVAFSVYFPFFLASNSIATCRARGLRTIEDNSKIIKYCHCYCCSKENKTRKMGVNSLFLFTDT